MNIVQAYTEFNKQNIILISGLPYSKKSVFAKFLAKLFDFEIINLENHYYDIETFQKDENFVEIGEDKILNWYNIYESIDWKTFNKKVNEHKKGIIIYGLGFPKELLDFSPNFHIHIKLSKQKLLDILEKEKKDDIMSSPDVINKLLFPTYIKSRENSIITKYMNSNNYESSDKLKKDIYDYIISVINNYLNNINRKIENKEIDYPTFLKS
jgi:tRNA uridine 5-carbamoylmethylation protein Kti12